MAQTVTSKPQCLKIDVFSQSLCFTRHSWTFVMNWMGWNFPNDPLIRSQDMDEMNGKRGSSEIKFNAIDLRPQFNADREDATYWCEILMQI